MNCLLSKTSEFVKYHCVNEDSQTTATIYSNYDSQLPAKKLISNQGYNVGSLYIKSTPSVFSFVFCMLLINFLLALTKP
ncbi:hypothetical protein V8B55DRAFT_1452857 [Mucor lusitanicus]|uniref:Uncharacterized protein n=2 Tax=Mucor circinelloides f. lusitanicus TaxID=29924 RepID=A0A168GFC5_MUCCL|nr:hypothetical protein FB192DRAFT_1461587 [Mucor lusitanicus]OAC97634.1 hypothetical protein MUCCIDRAFT_116293 [Mucor lusitanicus CBS 277.49]